MDLWIQNYLICTLISVVLTGLIIPKILLIAFRKKLFDEIDERKIHRGVVPRLGGIAFLPAILFSFLLVVGVCVRYGHGFSATTFTTAEIPVLFVFCSLMLIYVVGIADDLIGVRYRAKFIFQIIAGALIVVSGVWISNLHGFLWIWGWPAWIGIPATVFLVILVMNAINLIDGIDGLASGLCMIALIYYSCVFMYCGFYLYALLAGATLGALLPFFYYNVFGRAENHNKIFMGDTGSLTIGTVLVFLTIMVFNIPVAPGGENEFVLAIAPIIVPCFDVVRVFMHRVRRGSNPFLPDKCHIHHKLLALGMPQWKALILILIADAAFVAGNLILSSTMQPTWLILGDIAVWVLLNVLLTRMIRNREKCLGQTLYE